MAEWSVALTAYLMVGKRVVHLVLKMGATKAVSKAVMLAAWTAGYLAE